MVIKASDMVLSIGKYTQDTGVSFLQMAYNSAKILAVSIPIFAYVCPEETGKIASELKAGFDEAVSMKQEAALARHPASFRDIGRSFGMGFRNDR